MRRGGSRPWWRLARDVVLLGAGAAGCAAAWVLVPTSWFAVLALVLVLLVLPGLLLLATERRSGR
jgi:hypothetical protein